MTSIVVHPGSDLAYASYVLQGLTSELGERAIEYSTEGFPRSVGSGRILAFSRADDATARCFLAFHDHPRVNELALGWARVVGMVNLCQADVGRDGKVVAVGPTFGVRLRSRRATLSHVSHGLRWSIAQRERGMLGRMRRALLHERRRTTIDRYVPGDSNPDYVFFTAWPWVKHPAVNPPRARFIEACRRAPELTFEGGFAPRRRHDLPEVLSLSAPRRYGISEYIEKMRRSAIAFNNPAVHGCLGWKLGEYLALGKAIVTLPLERALPEPLEHGVHVHVVDGTPGSLDEAIDRIRTDDPYRVRLETESRAWFERNLAPAVLARRLLGALG
jgi:hypothetical protein